MHCKMLGHNTLTTKTIFLMSYRFCLQALVGRDFVALMNLSTVTMNMIKSIGELKAVKIF